MARACLYLPKEASDYTETLELIKGHMSRRYGGYTVIDATGGWESESGELIEEPVTIVESFADSSMSMVNMEMHELAEVVKRATEEEAVMYTVNNDHNLV